MGAREFRTCDPWIPFLAREVYSFGAMTPRDPEPDSDEQRRGRARARASWPIRRVDLASEGDDAPWSDPRESLASMWPLIVEAWTISGRELPSYHKSSAPGVIWRDGATPPEHAI